MVPKVGNLRNLSLPNSLGNVSGLCPAVIAHIMCATKNVAQPPMADLLATRERRLDAYPGLGGAFEDSDARECAISVPSASPDVWFEVKDRVLE